MNASRIPASRAAREVLGRARAPRRRRCRRRRRGRASPGRRPAHSGLLRRAEHARLLRDRTWRHPTMLRWTPAPWSPRRTWRGPPARCPSAALMLAPQPDRRPVVGARLRAALPRGRRPARSAGSGAARSPATTSRRSTCTSTPPAASPSAASSAPWTSRGAPTARRGRAVLPARGHPPRAGRRARRPDARDADQPAPILLVHRGPQRGPRPARRACVAAADHEFTDRAEQRHRVWAHPRPPTSCDLLADALAPARGPDRRRPPPVRGLPAAAAAAARAGHGPRPGDAGRPGRHPAVPRRDPPGPRRHVARRRCRAAAERGRVRAARPPTRHGRRARSRPTPLVVDRRHALGDAPARRLGATGPRSRCSTRTSCRPSTGRRRRIGYHHAVDEALAAVGRGAGVAVLMPAPDFDQVLRDRRRPTGCCRRRPRRSSPSPASGCSSARCATNEPARGHLHLHPRRRAAAGRKNRRRSARSPRPRRRPPGRHRAPSPRPATRRTRARRPCCRDRPPARPRHHHPERPHRVAAGQHPLLGLLGHPADQADLVDRRRSARPSSAVLTCTSPPRDHARAPAPTARRRRAAACGQRRARRRACGRKAGPERPEMQAGPPARVALLERMSGGVLLSHNLSVAVPSALKGLTSGFGMGPGVSLSLWPP